MEGDIETSKQISYGRLLNSHDFSNSTFIPDQVRSGLKSSAYYLFIYIPADEIIKVSIFPVQNPTIKKLLLRLKEFSPDLVKGISGVLKDFNLGDGTIHTTGLCFEAINCFYETYLDLANIEKRNISLEEIRQEFLRVPRVDSVEIIDVPVETF
ncbi:MAG: hypothetical protein KAR20_25520 [Candidatus Heimdallarchaeota archaeon]|nr:hypothetical protein [Candidatus Heimdallarchaeota archaeon]